MYAMLTLPDRSYVSRELLEPLGAAQDEHVSLRLVCGPIVQSELYAKCIQRFGFELAKLHCVWTLAGHGRVVTVKQGGR